MKFPLSEKHLLIIFSLLFVLSSIFLFWQNERELDPDQGKSWWTLSFTKPEDQKNLAFTLESHRTEATFQYQVVADKKILVEGTLILSRGETKTITPDIAAPDNTRTSIIVTSGTEKKEIYR